MDHLVNAGPVVVPVYPYSAWKPIPAEIDLHEVWKLCGPTVDRLMRQQPLWKVFAAVYLEGLSHGSGAQQDEGVV